MPTYVIPEFSHTLSNESVLLDTNVLVAAFLENDQYHETAVMFLNDWHSPFIVVFPVIVESWGMIVGARGNFKAGVQMLQWISSPGRATLYPDLVSCASDAFDAIGTLRIDCVDAVLVRMAHSISEVCSMPNSIQIATFDTKDFVSCRKRYGLKISVLDLRSLESY